MFTTQRTGLEKFQADHSLVTNYVRSENLSRQTAFVAFAAFATLDIAYHMTAVILKALRATVYTLIGSQTVLTSGPGDHLSPLKNALVALVAFPMIGTVSTGRVVELHNRMVHKTTVGKTIAVTLAVAGIAAAVYALSYSAAENLSLNSLHYPVNPGNANGVSDYEWSLNGLFMPIAPPLMTLLAGTLTVKTYRSMRQRRYGRVASCVVASMPGALFIAFGSLTVCRLIGRQEALAQAKIAKICLANGADHYSCRINEMASQALNLQSDRAFMAQAAANPLPPAVSELAIGEATNLSALRQLFGTSRDLSAKKVRALYNQLIHRPDPLPSNALDQELFAAARSLVRTTARKYTRELGSRLSHIFVMARDTLLYGSEHGPSYAQSAAKYCHLPFSEFITAVTNSAGRSNAAYNDFAQAL